MMFPKRKTRDPSFLREFRKKHKKCEICGSKYSLEIAHIISKGAGGPDVEENVVMLCGPAALQQGCHGENHLGNITKGDLFKIVGKRLSIDSDECEKIVRRAMGYNVE